MWIPDRQSLMREESGRAFILFCVCVCGMCRYKHPCMYTWRLETHIRSLYLIFPLTELGAPWLANRPLGSSLSLASCHREYRCALGANSSL